ncbi:MAG: NAD(P)-dependent oxidoreductase [Gemmatimonadaceae bacterium]
MTRTGIAFLGLGAIGRPMARRIALDERFELVVWNRTRATADDLAHGGQARVAATPAHAAGAAEFVITCLPTSADVESLLDGADGLLAGMTSGSVLIDCTSGDPAVSRRIARRLGDLGLGFIDAPVSGGTSGAEAGTLTVMCGGDESLLERAHPVISAFGRKIVRCGGVGTGHALKAVNNALLAVHIWSAAEGLASLAKAGVSPAVALDVINASSGRSNASENLFPERVLTRAFPRTFRLALLDKDVGIAASVAREGHVPSALLQLTAELFRTAHSALGEEADHVEAVKLVEQWAGVEIS